MLLLSVGRVAFILLYFVDISVQQSSAHWEALNATVQGRLVHGIPLARPCFKLGNGTGGDFDAEECTIIIQDYLNECKDYHFSVESCVCDKAFLPSCSNEYFLRVYECNSLLFLDKSI